MLSLNIKDESSRLRAVVLGTAVQNGPIPTIEQAYDPKSLEHILAGTYPTEDDMVQEMEAFCAILEKYEVQVYRPQIIPNCNQIFSRDIGFVIDHLFIRANILPDRKKEIEAIDYIIEQIKPSLIVEPPEAVHIEGGDIILWNDYIFIGTYKGSDYQNQITARTNIEAVHFLKDLFPNKKIKEFDLIKSDKEARDNALHLDCCFQPVGKDKAIIYREGFRKEADYLFLEQLFGKENLFHIQREEMYHMYSNIFSIAPNIVVSEKKFTRLNQWLDLSGFVVETVPYSEISKQEGLLRCSTLPLIRD